MQIQKSEAIRKAIDFLTDDNEVEDGKKWESKVLFKIWKIQKIQGCRQGCLKKH